MNRGSIWKSEGAWRGGARRCGIGHADDERVSQTGTRESLGCVVSISGFAGLAETDSAAAVLAQLGPQLSLGARSKDMRHRARAVVRPTSNMVLAGPSRRK